MHRNFLTIFLLAFVMTAVLMGNFAGQYYRWDIPFSIFMYRYVSQEIVYEGGTTGISGAQADDGIYENIHEYNYGRKLVFWYAENEPAQNTTSTTYINACTLNFNVTRADNYLVIVTFELRGSSTSYDALARLLIDGTVYGETNKEPQDITNWHSYGWIKRVYLGVGAHTVNVQFRSEATSATASIRNIHLLVWMVDMAYAENESEISFGTTETNLVSLTFGPPSAPQTYLVLASVESRPASTLYSVRIRLRVNDVERNYIEWEGQDTTDYAAHVVMYFENFSSTQLHTIRVTGAAESGTMYARRIRVAVIPLGEYEVYTVSDETQTSTTSTVWVDYLTLTRTTRSGEFLSFGSVMTRHASGTTARLANFVIDGTSYHEYQEEPQDTTDWVPAFFMKYRELTAGSHTWKIQRRVTGSTGYYRNARILVVTTKLAYRLDVEQRITGIPTADNHMLQIEYYITGDSENVSLYLYNFSFGIWEEIDILRARTLENYYFKLTDTPYLQGGEVRLRYVQKENDNDTTYLMIDFVRVRSWMDDP